RGGEGEGLLGLPAQRPPRRAVARDRGAALRARAEASLGGGAGPRPAAGRGRGGRRVAGAAVRVHQPRAVAGSQPAGRLAGRSGRAARRPAGTDRAAGAARAGGVLCVAPARGRRAVVPVHVPAGAAGADRLLGARGRGRGAARAEAAGRRRAEPRGRRPCPSGDHHSGASRMSLKRSHAARIAQETVEILAAGRYATAAGTAVHIRDLLDAAKRGTVSYPPDASLPDVVPSGNATAFEVRNETTLEAARRLVAEGFRPAALNFASARHP